MLHVELGANICSVNSRVCRSNHWIACSEDWTARGSMTAKAAIPPGTSWDEGRVHKVLRSLWRQNKTNKKRLGEQP